MSHAADDQRAREIVDQVARLLISKSSISEVEMQIANENWRRNISMRMWQLGEDNILIRVVSPPEDAGTAVLKVRSNSWYYLPKTRRTIKMPASANMAWVTSKR